LGLGQVPKLRHGLVPKIGSGLWGLLFRCLGLFGLNFLGLSLFGLGGFFLLFGRCGLFGPIGRNARYEQFGQILSVAVFLFEALTPLFLENDHFVPFQVLYHLGLHGRTFYDR